MVILNGARCLLVYSMKVTFQSLSPTHRQLNFNRTEAMDYWSGVKTSCAYELAYQLSFDVLSIVYMALHHIPRTRYHYYYYTVRILKCQVVCKIYFNKESACINIRIKVICSYCLQQKSFKQLVLDK